MSDERYLCLSCNTWFHADEIKQLERRGVVKG